MTFVDTFTLPQFKCLLRSAAAAIDCTVEFEPDQDGIVPYLFGHDSGDERGEWNPLDEDSDADELADQLALVTVEHTVDGNLGWIVTRAGEALLFECESPDHHENRRVAVVKAAAKVASTAGMV